ncbi:hypothetical protein [Streptomyces olivaceoviridis]|uniref:hypothetical protein n=1 Tax=Streptomyces olivaceoviridis TaxID=1921 RepID=UPI0036ADC1F5
MLLVRLFWDVDSLIGHLPAPLANLAAGSLVTGIACVYTALATGQWRHHNRTEDP